MDGRKQGKSLNVVHNDEIWKDHINRELLAQKHWPQKWGFLSEIFKDQQNSDKNIDDHNPASKNENEKEKKNFPQTHAQTIGWKSALTKKNAYGISEGRARGKCDILKTFDWPQESQ